MAAITTTFGSGGANLQPGGSNGSVDLATALRDIADDLAELRTKHNAAMAKLDADVGVTDTNYAATQNAVAMKTTKA